jgi:hypothetical protein
MLLLTVLFAPAPPLTFFLLCQNISIEHPLSLHVFRFHETQIFSNADVMSSNLASEHTDDVQKVKPSTPKQNEESESIFLP